jgi:hypothetical protein
MAQYIETKVSKKGKEKTDTLIDSKAPETSTTPKGQNPALRSKRLL